MDARARLQDWLRRLLAERGQSAHALAREAGIAASTLSRFLNDPAYSGTLSTTTLEKIARTTGAYPGRADPVAPMPAPREGAGTAGFGEAEAEPFAAGAAAAPFALPPGADVWRVKGRALDLAGYLPGDLVVVDGHATPRAGDIVCAQVLDAAGGTARTVLRKYLPPYLMAVSTAAAEEAPVPLDPETVAVMGVVTLSWRTRA